MASPKLTFQVAFASQPGDEPFIWRTVPGTQDVSYNRGEPNEYARAETGESSVRVGDPESALDPANAGELVNLVPNPSFEVDTSGWAPANVTLTSDPAEPKFGTKSGKMVVSTTAGAAITSTTLVVNPPGGEAYTCSARVFASGSSVGRTFRLQINEAGGSVGAEASGFVDVVLAAGWQEVIAHGSIIRSDRTGAYVLAILTSPVAGDVIYVDGVQFEQGATASDYVDGDQPNCRWAGTPHASPSYRGGPYFPNVKRMRPMRAFVTVDGVDYPLFQHFIERLPRTRSEANVWTERTITGVDGFAWLALASLKGQTYAAGQATGTRVDAVLDAANWPASRRNIDGGNSTLDPATFADNDSTKALEHLLDVVQSENGFGFVDADGDVRFIERHALIRNTAPVATFADGRSIDTGAYPDAVPYVDLQPESTDVFNDYTGARDGGTVYAATDATSLDEYGPRSQELTFLVDSDLVVQDALAWRLNRTKEPAERIDAITVMPGLDVARWMKVLGLEVGDRVLVVEWPPGFPAPVEVVYIIRHLQGDVPTDVAASTFTFQLTPASVDSWFIFDDPDHGFDNGKLTY